MTATILFSFSFSFLSAQEINRQNIDWRNIREAFKAYCQSPSPENAKRILSIMPVEFDNRTADFKEWVSISQYIYEDEPFRILERLIRKGDNFAIRIAFRTLEITDGSFTEDLCSLIAESIRANPTAFLEEAEYLIDHNRKGKLLDSILSSDYDIDTLALDENPPAQVEFRKEAQLRIKSLETVTRSDLLSIRDICIGKLKGMLDLIESK